MDTLEKVELVREKCGVSYEDAKEALEANNFDVLDAIVALERAGKSKTVNTASYTTAQESSGPVSPEMVEAQSEYHEQSKRSSFGDLWSNFCAEVKKIAQASVDMTFVAERNDERVLALPLLVVIIGLFVWGASLWLLILGLFFGFRYHIEGASPVTLDVNDVMDKAADMADDIRSDFSHDKDDKDDKGQQEL